MDLLLLLGDYAYEMEDNDGKNGDEYLKKMEPIVTK